MAFGKRLMELDRRWIFLLVALGTLIPLILPIGLAVRPTAPVQAVFDKVESLPTGSVVMLSFDYGPSTAPENDPMAKAVLRHCFTRGLKVVGISLFPNGGLTVLNSTIAEVTLDFPPELAAVHPIEPGTSYANLGYKDGGQAAMRQMAVNIHAVFPTDANGAPVTGIPLMGQVRSYQDVAIVVSIATGIIGEWWANLVNAQFGTPVAVGCTAVSTPKYYAYYQTGQMLGLIGGLKGASEYEELLIRKYPAFKEIYGRTGYYTATKGMDVQSIVHLIIVAFIVLGNYIYLASRRASAAQQGRAS